MLAIGAILIIAGYPRQFNLSSWVKSRYKFKALVKPKGKQSDRGMRDFKKDLLVGSEAVWRATQSSWWNWDGGSMIYFFGDGQNAIVLRCETVQKHSSTGPSYRPTQSLSNLVRTRLRVSEF